MIKKRKKVLIALSGGIDSAVSADLLLKQGYKVEAAFMKNWSSTTGLKYADCPWLQDRQDALRVAAFLRIPLHTLDFEKQYHDTVMKYFFTEYKAGRTPNPDVMCNKEIKFKLLYNWAMKQGFDYVATGHYAQIAPQRRSVPIYGLGLSLEPVEKSKDFSTRSKHNKQQPMNRHATLLRSKDEFKDQTYFIYNIKQEQLPHILFPIGHLKKTQVRAKAKKIGLPNADKKESMGLCFVGKIRLKDFLEQKLKPKKGKILLTAGKSLGVMPAPEPASRTKKLDSDLSRNGSEFHSIQASGSRLHPSSSADKSAHYGAGSSGMTQGEVVIGQHHGLHNFTIGQRQGIDIGSGGPYYVVKKDLKKNILYVTDDPNDPALETKEAVIHSVNWITKPEGLEMKDERLKIKDWPLRGRYRHQGDLIPCTVNRIDSKHYLVKFKTPQKALASGQSLVLYKGKTCLGGGVIG